MAVLEVSEAFSPRAQLLKPFWLLFPFRFFFRVTDALQVQLIKSSLRNPFRFLKVPCQSCHAKCSTRCLASKSLHLFMGLTFNGWINIGQA